MRVIPYTLYCKECEKVEKFDESGYCNACGNHADRVAILPQEDKDCLHPDKYVIRTNGHRTLCTLCGTNTN